LRGVAVQEGTCVRIIGTLWWTQLKMLQGTMALALCVALGVTIGSAFNAPSYVLEFGACTLGFLGLFLWQFFGEANDRQDDEAELTEKLTELFRHELVLDNAALHRRGLEGP
jgi:hypothetical protein